MNRAFKAPKKGTPTSAQLEAKKQREDLLGKQLMQEIEKKRQQCGTKRLLIDDTDEETTPAGG